MLRKSTFKRGINGLVLVLLFAAANVVRAAERCDEEVSAFLAEHVAKTADHWQVIQAGKQHLLAQAARKLPQERAALFDTMADHIIDYHVWHEAWRRSIVYFLTLYIPVEKQPLTDKERTTLIARGDDPEKLTMHDALAHASDIEKMIDGSTLDVEAFRKRLQQPGEPLRDYCDEQRLSEKNSTKTHDNLSRIAEQLAEELMEVEEWFDMKDDEGLALIAAYIKGTTHSIEIKPMNGLSIAHKIPPIRDRQYFKVIKLKKGRYKWDKVFKGRTYWNIEDSNNEFTVTSGKLSYTGVFFFNNYYSPALLDVADRTAIALAIIDQKYPGLTSLIPVTNGLIENDPFIPFWFAQQADNQAPVPTFSLLTGAQ